MKIGIYNAPGGDGVGGSELCAFVLAEALAGEHDVEVVHHKPALTRAGLTDAFAVNLDGVGLRYVAQAWKPYGTARNPIRRYREEKEWQSVLSAPYDLFVAFVHDVPPFCHARIGIFVVLFAAHERVDNVIFRNDRTLVSRYVKRLYHVVEWWARMRTYRRKLAISQFTREWTRRRWLVDCDVLYPPADGAVGSQTSRKDRSILSVGRFTTHGHSKRQLEMMDAFRAVALRSSGWTYTSAGGLTHLTDDRAYFETVRTIASTCGARAEANVSRTRLDEWFSTASIFWHGAGYGVDEATHPELVEHYGISTVEAMASGCVPVVINRGGQREIVEHGVSGFLWDDFDELQDFTLRLMDDDDLRRNMSAAARERAVRFGRSEFVRRATQIVASCS